MSVISMQDGTIMKTCNICGSKNLASVFDQAIAAIDETDITINMCEECMIKNHITLDLTDQTKVSSNVIWILRLYARVEYVVKVLMR